MKKLLLFLLLIPAISFSQETYGGFNTFLDTYVATNGTRAITGSIMNSTLKQINQSLGLRYYDATRPYQEDSVAVIYDGSIWLCNTAISTPEAWNAAKWTRITADEFLWEKTASGISSVSTYDVVCNAGLEIGSVSAPSGAIALANNKGIWFEKSTLAMSEILSLNSSDLIELYNGKITLSSAGLMVLNGQLEFGSTVATNGEIRLNKSGSIQARNATNTADISLIRLNSDDVELADGTVQITTDGDVSIDGKLAVDTIENSSGSTIVLDGDVEITGNLNTDVIPHMFVYFGDSTVTYTFAASSTWYHLSNVYDTLWVYDGADSELNNFTYDSDTLIVGVSGDYNMDAHIGYEGGNGVTYAYRYYNVTQAKAIPTAIPNTARGTGNVISNNIGTYAKGLVAGDRIILQVMSDGTTAITLKNSTIRIQYIHD